MPKIKATVSENVNKYVAEYPRVFQTDGYVLFCKICNKIVSSEKKYQVDQHLRTLKHRELYERRTLIAASTEAGFNEFSMDLCEAFISADIPLSKLSNPQLSTFLRTYTNEHIPQESTELKTYIDQIYIRLLNEMKNTLKHHFLWVSIDETTDIQGRYVANVIVGILHENEDIRNKKFLLNVVELDKINYATISRAFNDSITLLGEDFDKNKVLLFLTNSASYMAKAARGLKIFYPKLLHVTCLALSIHRLAEEISSHFNELNLLISNGGKLFLKAPSRVQVFNAKFPGIPLPLEPITTRWGTWLDAVKYYAQNLEEFAAVVAELDDSDSKSIKNIKQLLSLPSIKSQLFFVHNNYGFLCEVIKKLEGSNSLRDAVDLVDTSIKRIYDVKGTIGQEIMKTSNLIFQKNKGFLEIRTLARILEFNESCSKTKYNLNELSAFKYAPLTFFDVERSFSSYENYLGPNGESFVFENFKKIFFVYANKAINK
ncbi:PREDICTED: uncharacterized protein LOC108363449 [Rhagoletis zephyria]|uniref:uncharacterized protein LOC108363449 n=1 Tax=Rhagoletis zephyria TaxID=28612 RepID=UPI00081189AA|nr:PREDICTED: uncharacterized protein LOC108363449 [Rhagoletis zephyria]